MSQYIGALGQLVEIECEGTEKVSQEPRYVEHFTITGRRRVQAIPRQPRQWGLGHDALRGQDESLLAAFVNGSWGRGPWHWVPVAAQFGNLLTPQQSALQDYRTSGGYFSPAGPIRVSDGSWAARSLAMTLASGWVGLLDPSNDRLPVVPGTSFTWSAELDSGQSAAPQLQLQFLNGQGASVGFYAQAGEVRPGMQRVSMTRTVPSDAVSALVGMRAPVQRLAQPQATWTAEAVPFTEGRGCRKAVVERGNSDLLSAESYRRGLLFKTDFTVLEVA